MTMSSSQRVGDAMQFRSKGLAPVVERELKTACRDEGVLAVLEADPTPYPQSDLRGVTSGPVRVGAHPRERSQNQRKYSENPVGERND